MVPGVLKKKKKKISAFGKFRGMNRHSMKTLYKDYRYINSALKSKIINRNVDITHYLTSNHGCMV